MFSVPVQFSLWGEHKQIVAEKSNNAAGTSTDADARQAEISLYLRYPLEPLECNPIEWWQRHALTFPNLVPLALKLLTILATSVPSERLFSKAGETMTKKRNSLLSRRLSQFLFLQSVHKRFWDL